MKYIVKIIATAAMFAFAAPAFAGGIAVDNDDTGKLSISSKFFLNATQKKSTVNGTTSKQSTGLAVDRAYLTIKYKMDDIWSMKLTTDATLNTAATGKKTEVFVKNAFIQADFMPELTFTIGVIGTPWVGYENKLGKHRYVSKSYVDTHKFDSSADAGVGLSGKIADGLASYAVAIVNGKGYGDITATDAVDFNSRIGFYPVKGLTIDLGYRSGYLGSKVFGSAGDKSTLTQALITYGMGKDFRIGGNYISNKKTVSATAAETKTTGIETWAWAKFGDGLGAFGRYENTKTDLSTTALNEKENRYVVGLEYFANKNITMSLAWDQAKKTNKGHVAGATSKDSRYGLYTQAKF